MLKIDSHQHFWLYDPVKDSWITDDMKPIQKHFLPADLVPLLAHNHVSACVAVQANQSEAENSFLLDLALAYPFIKGIVGWVDLRADNVDERLQHYKEYSLMKGFRHILQAEEDDRYMLSNEFKRGISLLNQYGFTYDILIMPHHLTHAIELVKEFPEQRFVIDHMAKPDIKKSQIALWQTQIEEISKHRNVYCKVSGFCTQANWIHWKMCDIEPYLEVVFNAFGADRVMYGSDWPVCIIAGGVNKSFEVLNSFLTKFPDSQQSKFWSENAMNFYNLDIKIPVLN